jgi:hypothetical protein
MSQHPDHLPQGFLGYGRSIEIKNTSYATHNSSDLSVIWLCHGSDALERTECLHKALALMIF